MKLYTPEQVELIEVKSVTPDSKGLVIDGQIMGTMPMKANPREGIVGNAQRPRSQRRNSMPTSANSVRIEGGEP